MKPINKQILLIASILLLSLAAVSCPVCDRQQPKILKGIAHGAGPESRWDYLIVAITILIVVATLYYSIKWMVQPGETSASHIKRFILNNE